MAYAVELNFDAPGDEKIRALWGRLSDAGVESFVHTNGASPHISLAVYDDVDERALAPRLAEFARGRSLFVVNFAQAGTFPGPASVVFLAPTPTIDLLQLHAQWHAGCPDLVSWPHYRPGAWVPHCTLCQDAPKDKIGQGVALAREVAFPLSATIESIGLVRFLPLVEVYRFPLLRR